MLTEIKYKTNGNQQLKNLTILLRFSGDSIGYLSRQRFA